MSSFYYPVLGLGPLHVEWSAAAYERMQARRDAQSVDCLCGSCSAGCQPYCMCETAYCAPHSTWDDPYVRAAHAVERAALERLHTARLGGPRPLTYKQRMLL